MTNSDKNLVLSWTNYDQKLTNAFRKNIKKHSINNRNIKILELFKHLNQIKYSDLYKLGISCTIDSQQTLRINARVFL